MSELRNLMHARAAELTQAGGPMPDAVVATTAKAASRKRTTRAVGVSVAAGAAAVAVGLGAWLGYSHWHVAPAVSPSPSVSPTASPTPTPSATASPADPHSIVSGADVGILERLENPTTGETWHAPVQIDDPGIGTYASTYFSVGERDGAQIVVAAASEFEWMAGGHFISGMYEVAGDNIRFISCPSARAGDLCADAPYEWQEAGGAVDTTTHYDTLTFPTTTSPVAGWNLATSYSGYDYVASIFGDANGLFQLSPDEADLLGRSQDSTLAGLGASNLVEYLDAGQIAGTTSVRFAIQTPFGTVLPLPNAAVPDWYTVGSVTWNDGKDTWTFQGLEGQEVAVPAPATRMCFGADEVLLENFDARQWQAAGTQRTGATVYLPVEGGNDIAHATWTWMKDNSGADQIDPSLAYPYDTFDEFLEARSAFAWQRPDGAWVLAISSHAAQRVYECA